MDPIHLFYMASKAGPIVFWLGMTVICNRPKMIPRQNHPVAALFFLKCRNLLKLRT